jgi:hypothetical protein
MHLCSTGKLTSWSENPRRKKMLTHFQFHKVISLYWLTGKIVTEEVNHFSRKQTASISTITNSLSADSSFRNKKAQIVNETSLDPKHGSLKGRWNDNYANFPECSLKKQPCCSLCWCFSTNRNNQTYTSVFQRDVCNVHLCIRCFKPFHTIASVKNLKSQVLLSSEISRSKNYLNRAASCP